MKCAAAIALVLVCSHNGWGQAVVQGRILSSDSVAIVAAHVELADSIGSMKLDAVTDSGGRFRIPLPQRIRPGLFFMTVSSLGYATVERKPVRVEQTERVLVQVWMARGLVVLDPVNVVAHRRYRPDVSEEFADRAYWIKRTGNGHVLEYDELQQMAGMSLVQAVSRLPGVRWERIGGVDAVRMRGCVPTVYLDRVPLDITDLSSIHAMDLEGIEVYRGAEEVPAQYAVKAGTCGVILAWTNMRVENARPLTWKRVAIAVGLGLIIFVVVR